MRRIRFRTFHFRNARPGWHFGVRLLDWNWPTRRNAHNYKLGWWAFQPHLCANLGPFGVEVGLPLDHDGRHLDVAAYSFPKGGT